MGIFMGLAMDDARGAGGNRCVRGVGRGKPSIGLK
jgi:hypothetical protein